MCTLTHGKLEKQSALCVCVCVCVCLYVCMPVMQTSVTCSLLNPEEINFDWTSAENSRNKNLQKHADSVKAEQVFHKNKLILVTLSYRYQPTNTRNTKAHDFRLLKMYQTPMFYLTLNFGKFNAAIKLAILNKVLP